MIKTVTLLTGTESTRLELVSQLETVLQGVVNLKSFATDSGLNKRVNADLVVLSTELIRDEAMPWIDQNCPCLTARRTLDITRIDELFAIPAGQTLLLVNDLKETTEEAIALIRNLGLDHFELIPYYPGCGIIKGPDKAITMGEQELVPDFVTKIIDLGPRIIDMTTVVEILERLDLLEEKAALVSARYMETIIRLHRELYQSLSEKARINDYLTQILDGVNDGIIGFDRHGTITMFSQRCEEIFGLGQRKCMGRRIQQLFKNDEVDFLLNSAEGADRAMIIKQREYVLNRFTVEGRGAIVCTIRDIAENNRMLLTVRRDLLRKGHVAKYRFDDIMGDSPLIKETIIKAKKLANTGLNVLIQGETGTGKELFASAIHRASPRAEGPFIAVNFGALPEELVESELFGYVEGAFTGAKKGGKTGLFEQANGGTLFLDEIGDISLRIQTKLLRVLQEKEVMRVGGTDIIPVDVRIIAATHRQLSSMCAEGKFREDLYFRLKRLFFKTPPLRERQEDILPLLRWFLTQNGRGDLAINAEVETVLSVYHWPGNVRELESVAEYLTAVCDGFSAGATNLPPDMFQPAAEIPQTQFTPAQSSLNDLELLMSWIVDMRNQNLRVGRRSLALRALRENIHLTESQIRSKLAFLAERGDITISTGRKGVEISR